MNPTLTPPGQPQMQVQVILASTTTLSPTLYTVRMRYPRIIHGEFMTHRVFGRNAGSSRARPARVTIQEVRDTPFIPWHWTKNMAGMQGKDYLSAAEVEEARAIWMQAAFDACRYAEALTKQPLNCHKQIFNRLLEPFSWIDVLATGTDWDNFLWLRDHEDAEPHIRDLAVLVRQALETAETQELKPGEWHLPYITDEDRRQEGVDLRKVSAARCARISYKPFDSDTSDIAKDLQLYEKLVGSDRVHASPLEHEATPDKQVSNLIDSVWANSELHGPLDGWIQFRKLVPGECYRG